MGVKAEILVRKQFTLHRKSAFLALFLALEKWLKAGY
jgi:hypothetical protein